MEKSGTKIKVFTPKRPSPDSNLILMKKALNRRKSIAKMRLRSSTKTSRKP